MKRDNLSKNFIYQFLYQGIVLVIPLILSPYLTRTLQETALGTYSYVNSIAYYFVVLANLGISRYGQRIISRNTENEITLRKVFWSLFTLHVVISAVSIVLYFVYILVFVHNDQVIYIIEALYVTSALFDITWLFYGLENFKTVVIKNAFVKVTECLLIFLFVHKPSDLWIYTIITAGGLLAGQIVMIPQAVHGIKPIGFGYTDVKQHMKPLLVFAIAVIASTLYTVFDKTLLGILGTIEEVAFYEYSNRIITVPKTIVSVIGTVMYPRACKLAADGDLDGQRKYIRFSFFFTALIGIGSITGLLGVSNLFAEVYFGKAFSICGNVMMALSPVIYIIGIGDVIRTQYMIPNGMENHLNVCIILSAVINISLSSILIPIIGIFGAVLGTISAEMFGLLYQMVLCKKFIKFSDIVETALPFVIIGVIMLVFIKAVSYVVPYNSIGLFVEVIICAGVFGLLTLLYTRKFNKDVWDLLFANVIRWFKKH